MRLQQFSVNLKNINHKKRNCPINRKIEVKSPEELINLIEQGKIPEGEVDAISMTNLTDKREKLEDLLVQIGGE